MIFLVLPASSPALAAEERQIERRVDQTPNLTAPDIIARYAGATVVVSFAWRLYDADSGRKLYQRVVDDEGTGRRYPAFVRLSGGEIVRWLTVDDPDGINIAAGGPEARPALSSAIRDIS